jgi:hypothetical protein
MYIKYEASEGSPSFVENNDLNAHISNIRLSLNNFKCLNSYGKIFYNTLPHGPFDSKYLVFTWFCLFCYCILFHNGLRMNCPDAPFFSTLMCFHPTPVEEVSW